MNKQKCLALIMAAVLLLLCGCASEAVAEQTQAPETQATEATEQTQAPETQATEATEQTQAPTEPEQTQEVTEPEQEGFRHHSCIREDGTFNGGALFIGDSLTYGLVDSYLKGNQLLGDARYMAMSGAALSAFYYGPRLGQSAEFPSIQSEEFRDLLMCQALEQAGGTVQAIYWMMGTNHVKSVTVQMYIDTVELMLEACPDATVYMQLVPYDESPRVNSEIANEMIREAYAYFAEREESRVFLIDSQSAIGYHLTVDGIHLTEEGQRLWYQALVAFAEENNIPE